MNICIKGFTPLQRAIADMVWSFETENELVDWYYACADNIKPIAISVIMMLKYEALDQNPIEDMSEALEVIDHIKEM